MAKEKKDKKGVTVVKKGAVVAGDTGKKSAKDNSKRSGKGTWHGGGDGDDLATEVASLGLRIKNITGDGNCFFRALGDQLEGDEKLHAQLRQRVMAYIAEHEDDFAPFVEDDESFGSYVARMRKDGVWAGYMEVVAASRCLWANLTIYQAGQPRWRVLHHPEDTALMLHLSYHDGQHYNSVRAADDFSAGGPPAPVVLRGNGSLPARPQRSAGDAAWDERDERRVAESTACADLGLVRRALGEAAGDVDTAIERVIEALAAAEAAEEDAGVTTEEAAAPAEAATAGPASAGAEGAAAAATGTAEAALPTPSVRQSGPASPAGAVAAGQGGSGAPAVERQAGASALTDSTAAPAAAVTEGGPAATSGSDGTPGGFQGDGTIASEAVASSPSAPSNGAASTGHAESAAASAHPPSVEPATGSGGAASKAKGAARKAEGSRKAAGGGSGAAAAPSNNKRCPCGSNKKYKACCGPAAAAAERRRAVAGEPGGATEGTVATAGAAVAAQVAALVI